MNYGKHSINAEDLEAVNEVLKSDFLTCGPKVQEFEEALAEYTGAKYAVAVTNGTAALYLLARALKFSTAIVPDITFMATANAFKVAGKQVWLRDIRDDQPMINRDRVGDADEKIVPVHMMGYPIPMTSFERSNTIEDACHALGAQWHDQQGWHNVGDCSHSLATVFSFHPVKPITTGEGGAITTNDSYLYHQLKCLRNHGIENDRYDVPTPSLNFRMSDIQAGLGISQLKRIDAFTQRRHEIASIYNDLLPEYSILPTRDQYPSYHLYCIKVPSFRNELRAKLKMEGINTQIHYRPLHTLNPYRMPDRDFPNAMQWHDQTLSLPIYYGLTDKEVKRVADLVLRSSYGIK